MKVKQRDVYLSEYETWSFKQRLYYILKNKMATNVRSFLPRRGFMRWCLRDLLNLLWLVICLPVLWLTVGIPLALYLAHDLKTRYVGYAEISSGWDFTEATTHYSKVWVLEE